MQGIRHLSEGTKNRGIDIDIIADTSFGVRSCCRDSIDNDSEEFVDKKLSQGGGSG